MSAKMNLNLDKMNSDKPVLIFHSIHYRGKRFRISSGQTIEIKFWDKDNQKVKRSRINYDLINKKLQSHQNDIERIILKLEGLNRPVEKEKIVAQLSWSNNFAGNENLLSVFKHFMNQHGKGKAQRTIDGLNTTYKHLANFYHLGKKITFQDFNQSFYNDFRMFLALSDNAFGFHIKNLKVFLKWTFDNGYHENENYRKWKVTHEDGKPVFYLKFDEIQTIRTKELEPRHDRVRDLFLIGCYTGFRFSDLHTLEPMHYKDGFIIKTTLKTKEPVKIPVVNELKTILEKYWTKDLPLPKLSNQKANQYLKELVEASEIDRDFLYIQKKGKEIIETNYKAFKMVSFHTARHTFITIALQLKVSPDTVRRIVGHKNFSMMARYTQNDDDYNKKELDKISLEK